MCLMNLVINDFEHRYMGFTSSIRHINIYKSMKNIWGGSFKRIPHDREND